MPSLCQYRKEQSFNIDIEKIFTYFCVVFTWCSIIRMCAITLEFFVCLAGAVNGDASSSEDDALKLEVAQLLGDPPPFVKTAIDKLKRKKQ